MELKIAFLIILVSVSNVLAIPAYSQVAKVSLDMENKSLEQIMDEIESQSEFYFIFNQKQIDINRVVNIQAENELITDILPKLFVSTDVNFAVFDRKILLTTDPLENSLLAIASATEAPQNRVTGTVTDKDGAPLPGVNVVITGTIVGAITDIAGKYSIEVPQGANSLTFSFVGMEPQEITIGTLTQINVTMIESAIGLGEVVVVGYGTRLKEELTGSISSVSSKSIEMASEPNIVNRLQGQVSGVTISSGNTPNAPTTIRLRGIGTINDADPLYIIDGVPVGPGNDLSPNDIESISILKDASSAAIYGTRGANGVIIITTKRGRLNQRPNITFTARNGVTQPDRSNEFDMLNTQEYAEALWLSYDNMGVAPHHAQYGSGTTPVIPDYILPAGAMEGSPGVNPDLYSYPSYQIFKANKEGTNWYDEIYQKGMVKEYDLSVRGGGENSTYAFSGNYLSEDGSLKYTGFKRYSFRVNSDSKFRDWVKVSESIQVSYTEQFGNLTDNAEGGVIARGGYRTQPIIPVYDIMGNFAGSKAPEMGNSNNGLASLYRAKDNYGRSSRVLGNVFAELTPTKNITFKSMIGYNFDQWNSMSHTLLSPEISEPPQTNSINVNSNYSLLWNWSNTLNYQATFAGVHKVNITLGTEAIENNYQAMAASRSQFFSEAPDYMQLNAGELNKDNSGTGSAWSMFSTFGRLNYDLMGKYFLETTIRRDGSSRFSSLNRYQIFPAASFAWMTSDEKFMAFTSNWLNLLKIRLGWGVSGNDRIGNYNSYTTYATHSYRSAYAIDGSNTSSAMGFQPNALGNENVTWETSKTINFGLDAEMLDKRLTFSLDVWQRNTEDMLYRLQIPMTMGVATAPFVNIGTMQNTGFDFELGYRNVASNGKFRYEVKAVISRYVNEITKLSNKVNEEILGPNQRGFYYTHATTGSAFPEFYGYEVEGIFQTEAEATAYPQFGNTSYNEPGHYKFKNQLTVDTNGDGVPDEADDVIDSKDMTYIGSPHPDFTGGLNIDLGYGGFDLNMFFYGSYGNEMVSYVSRFIDYGLFNGGLSKDVLYKSWGSPYLDNNENATLAKFDNNEVSQQPSTAFLHDASFLRLKTLQLGYTVPKRFLDRVQIEGMQLYVQATNVFLITGYKGGLDPEINTSGMSMGIDNGSWPTAKRIIFGIKLSL